MTGALFRKFPGPLEPKKESTKIHFFFQGNQKGRQLILGTKANDDDDKSAFLSLIIITNRLLRLGPPNRVGMNINSAHSVAAAKHSLLDKINKHRMKKRTISSVLSPNDGTMIALFKLDGFS